MFGKPEPARVICTRGALTIAPRLWGVLTWTNGTLIRNIRVDPVGRTLSVKPLLGHEYRYTEF